MSDYKKWRREAFALAMWASNPAVSIKAALLYYDLYVARGGEQDA